MDTAPDQHRLERKMVFTSYFQILQAVVVKNEVIYPLARGTFFVYIFVLLGISGYTGKETQNAMVFYVNGASIGSRRALRVIRAIMMWPHFSGQRYLWASLIGSFLHEHIWCPALQS